MLSKAQKNNRVIAIYRDSFTLGSPTIETWEPGQNIEQIVDRMKCLPADFRSAGGVVMVNGTEVPAVRWRYVKPKAHSAAKPVAVTFHMPPKGGSGGGGKRIFALIAALALSVITAGIGALGIPGIVAGGTLGAKLLAAGVGLVGSLVISAISSTPVTENAVANPGSDGAALEPASVNGNMLQPNSPIPHVIGTRDVYPPFLTEPTIELIGQDEYVDALYGLAGAHAATNHRIGKASIDATNTDADLQLSYFDGLPESDPITYPQRYTRTVSLGNEMSVQGVSATDANVYVGPLPVWHGMSTADSPHEAWLHLLIVGLIRQADTSQYLRVPIRIRMRKRGDPDWRYLPEIHYMDKTQVQRRLQFQFLFGTAFVGTPPAVASGRGFIEARKFVPAQNVAPLGADFESDAYFSSGAGDDVYRVGTNATTKVTNTILEPDKVTFYLDEASWPAGIYDIEVKRGTAFLDTNFTSSTYVYSGNVYDFYGLQASGNMPLSRDGVLDRINLIRLVSVKNEPPIDQKNLTLIHIRARNRTVDNYSFTASGYTRDWDGVGWNTLTTTSNPVPHYRDILSGNLNYDPLPDELHDTDALLEWRQSCIDNGYTCDMVCENMSVQETLRIVASCGYASPYQSEVWGVVRDYDRSAEAPIQIFSPRNINGFKWRKAFQRMPAGLRVNFKSDQYQYTGKQIVVYRAGADESDARTEQVTYEGLISREAVTARAKFDLKQGVYRSTIYSWSAPIENIVCRRGSLVGLSHDVTQQHYGSGRIDAVTLDEDDNITGVILDNVIDIYNNAGVEATPDILAVDDFLQLGLQTSIAIRGTNGVVSDHPLSNETGSTDVLTFATPIADVIGVQSSYDPEPTRQIDVGCLVIVGVLGKIYKRLLISEIIPGKDLTATISALDEAPEIWQEAA